MGSTPSVLHICTNSLHVSEHFQLETLVFQIHRKPSFTPPHTIRRNIKFMSAHTRQKSVHACQRSADHIKRTKMAKGVLLFGLPNGKSRSGLRRFFPFSHTGCSQSPRIHKIADATQRIHQSTFLAQTKSKKKTQSLDVPCTSIELPKQALLAHCDEHGRKLPRFVSLRI